MVQACFIDRRSAASKNISQKATRRHHERNHRSGYQAELAVIRLLTGRRWVFEFCRAKTEIGEIDLIFTKDADVCLIEVKRLDQSWRSFERISKRQLTALQKNLVYFSCKWPHLHFKAYLAWVSVKNEISFVPIE